MAGFNNWPYFHIGVSRLHRNAHQAPISTSAVAFLNAFEFYQMRLVLCHCCRITLTAGDTIECAALSVTSAAFPHVNDSLNKSKQKLLELRQAEWDKLVSTRAQQFMTTWAMVTLVADPNSLLLHLQGRLCRRLSPAGLQCMLDHHIHQPATTELRPFQKHSLIV